MKKVNHIIPLKKIEDAQQNIKELVKHTPLIKMLNFSEKNQRSKNQNIKCNPSEK